MNRQGSAGIESARLRELRPDMFREAPWFGSLMDAFIFLDASLRRELEQVQRPLACGPGCDACCKEPIPLSLVESMGIRLYLAKTGASPFPPPDTEPLRCPFLNPDGHCVLYPVRPFACRRYLVFDRCCGQGENAAVSRPGDVHRPSPKKLLHALQLTLPVYRALGHTPPDRPDLAFFKSHSTIIQNIPWSRI